MAVLSSAEIPPFLEIETDRDRKASYGLPCRLHILLLIQDRVANFGPGLAWVE